MSPAWLCVTRPYMSRQCVEYALRHHWWKGAKIAIATVIIMHGDGLAYSES